MTIWLRLFATLAGVLFIVCGSVMCVLIAIYSVSSLPKENEESTEENHDDN